MSRLSRGALGFALVLALGIAPFARPALAAAPTASAGARQAAKDLQLLHSWMTGSFSSHAQAVRDTSFRDVRLRIVPIWPAMSAAQWFYVEQALAGREDAPYRQRVYRLSLRDDRRYESAVFTLPAPSRFVGAWRAPIEQRLGKLTPDSLTLRDGCAVILRKQRDRFAGGTEGKGCASELRGAAYATSEVEILSDRMITLDRGWDAAGKQVWGSTKGGYEFVRTKD
jgi:hypothetical protein